MCQFLRVLFLGKERAKEKRFRFNLNEYEVSSWSRILNSTFIKVNEQGKVVDTGISIWGKKDLSTG